MKKVNLKEAKGITLVALVITVIILLILAGVALSLVIGENGLIAKSKTAVEKYKDKSTDEKWQLEDFEAGIEEISLDELEDEEKHPELKVMKLEIKVEEGNETIQLPVYTYEYEDYEYDFEVDWGDGIQKQNITNEKLSSATHTYVPGVYTITVEGTYESLFVDWKNESMQKALIKVSQWGATGLKYIDLSNCSNLINIATPSKNSFVNVTRFSTTFSGCSNLQNIPERLFANCPDVTSFYYTFSGCSNLQSIPERLFANCPNVTSFSCTFSGCSNLQSIPERLFANCPNVTSFYCTFSGCSSLTGKAIELWKEGRGGINENNGGESCYYACEGLEDYEQIPEYWKKMPAPV